MQSPRNGVNGVRHAGSSSTSHHLEPASKVTSNGKGKARETVDADGSDEDEEFVYNGVSSGLPSSDSYGRQLASVLGEEASSFSYDEQLERVLGESKRNSLGKRAEPPDKAAEMVRAPSRSASGAIISEAQNDILPSSPTPSNASRFMPSNSLASSFASSIGLGRPSRRPAVHPQISRLRSSQTPSGFRIPSGSSYTTAQTRPGGYRAFSPSSSQFDLASRRSSASHLPDGMSPALSELQSSSATSQAGAAIERNPVKWTPLKRLASRLQTPKLLSKAPQPAPPAMGRPTALAAGGVVCIGTANGWTQVFDYSQTLRCTCGSEAIANEAGAVTALSISQDHSFIAVGHALGAVYLYNLTSPAQPVRAVPPVSLEAVIAGRAEGHIAGSAIRMLTFVGARHTAVLTADDRGMAFAHSLGKVLGLANTDVARILGRYPDEGRSKAGRTSPILDAAALPLGTTPHAADAFSLVALITPIKLVLVGLKPKPRTWWRGKPSEGQERKPQTGALAWQPNIGGQAEHPLLAYVWDEKVKVLSVVPGAKESEIEVKEQTRRKADASVLALHWLSTRTLLLVLATHLEILDVPTGQRTGRAPFELASLAGVEDAKPASDLFGAPALSALNVRSLRVYKSKIFVLLPGEVRVGTVLSWADRILSLVSTDNLLEAIALTTSFYVGEAHASSLGLPEDDEARHSIVQPKLTELLNACVEYVFSDDRMRDGTHNGGIDRTSLFEGLVDTSIRASLAQGDMDFLWDEVFERFLENGIERIFLERLESFVLKGQMRTAPTQVLQKLIALHEEKGEADVAEQIIWHVDPTHLDLNQVLSLCRKWRLYDAYAFVQSRALKDFVAPLIEFLGLVRHTMQDRHARPELANDMDGAVFVEEDIADAYKAFIYLGDTLTGLSYPSKELLPHADGLLARSSLYDFLFSGRSLAWPPNTGNVVLTADEEGASEPTYPYIRLLLRFDAEAALDALDAAFEDSYLNEGASVDRQLMINVLLEVMNLASSDFSQADRTFLHIFVARNVAKFQQMQFVLLPPSTSHRILVGLTDDPDWSTSEDRQLAAEYLLSVYQPHDLPEMLQRFEHAQFYRILRSIYRGERRWAALASVYLRDPDAGGEVFANLRDILKRSANGDDADEAHQAQDVVLQAIPQLANIDAPATASLVDRYFPDKHDEVVQQLSEMRPRQYAYLRWLFASRSGQVSAPTRQLYVDLLAEYNSSGVIAFLAEQRTVDAESIAICERHEIFDAVVWSLDRNGQAEAALDRFEDIIETRGDLLRHEMLQGEEPDEAVLAQAAAVARAVCSLAVRKASPQAAENAWVRILGALVGLSRVAPGPATAPMLTDALAMLVGSDTRRMSLSRMARRLLDDGSGVGGNFGALRPLIDGLLAAQRSEAATLSAAKQLAEDDRFESFAAYSSALGQGWAPILQPSEAICEACGELAWPNSLTSRSRYHTPSTPVIDLPQMLDGEDDSPVSRLALTSPEQTRPLAKVGKRRSIKGKEPIEPDEARRHAMEAARAARKADWRLASGVILRRDGKVFHRGCFEAVNGGGAEERAQPAQGSPVSLNDESDEDESRHLAVSMR